MATGPTNTSGLRGTGLKTGGPLTTGFGGFSLCRGRDGAQRLSEFGSPTERHQPEVSGEETLNLYVKIHIHLYINYTDIFNLGTHSGFHLTEQDTEGKTFFMAM